MRLSPTLAAAFAVLFALPALAWDAGPAECRHKECSGAISAQKLFVHTDCAKFGAAGTPKWSCPAGQDLYGGVCYKGCPGGTHRTAVCSCKKNGTNALDITAVQTSCGKFGAAGTPKASCPSGQDLYGGVCYKGCPSELSRSAVCSCQGHPKWSGNTHLWVVNRGIDLLKSSGDQTAVRIANALNAPACRDKWESGLFDGDEEPLNERPNTALGSHFYNGAGRDWFGKPTAVTTYSLAQTTVQNKSGDARSNARKRVEQVKSLSQPDSCYQLGLALHYVTDSTQPMHTSGLAATDYSVNLHPVWEGYVPVIQTRFPAAGWDKRFVKLSPDEAVHQIAVRSNALAKKVVEAVDPHKLPICTYEYATGILYTGRCFRNDPKVDAVTGEILRDAYQSAASFLYVAGKSRL